MKICKICLKEKRLEEFYKHRKYSDGYRTYCKSCSKKYEQIRYFKLKSIGSKYIKNKQETTRIYSYKKKFGISIEQYDDILKSQNYSCAICEIHESVHKTKLHIDHNHKTGEIRGLLCDLCNRFLINKQTDPEIFLKAAKYLSNGTGLFVPEKENA